MLNPKNHYLVRGQNFYRNNFVTQNNTRRHQKCTSSNSLELCWVICCKKKLFSFVITHTENNFENIVNHIIQFGSSLANFIIRNLMNTPNELNSVWRTFYFLNSKFCHLVDIHVVTRINRYA